MSIPVPLDCHFSSAGVTSASVASVRADFDAIPVSLKALFIYQQELKGLLFSPIPNLWLTRMLYLLIEPRMVSPSEFSEILHKKNPNFRTRCCCTYSSNTARSSWARLNANRQSVCATMPAHLTLALFSTASVTDTQNFGKVRKLHHPK